MTQTLIIKIIAHINEAQARPRSKTGQSLETEPKTDVEEVDIKR